MVGLGNVTTRQCKVCCHANSSELPGPFQLPLSGGTLTGTLNGTVATFYQIYSIMILHKTELYQVK
jgi:hypothetical protein